MKRTMKPMHLCVCVLVLLTVTAAAGLLVTALTAPEGDTAEHVLNEFFSCWHTGNRDGMLPLTSPSWQQAQEDPAAALSRLLEWVPEDDLEIVSISGSEADTMRTAKVRVTIRKDRYAFQVVMIREDGRWYINPQSLALPIPPTAQHTPTQPPLSAGMPAMALYYNPDGGSYYHLDPNCPAVSARYLPMQGQFFFSQLNNEGYRMLEPCRYCGAPARGNQSVFLNSPGCIFGILSCISLIPETSEKHCI